MTPIHSIIRPLRWGWVATGLLAFAVLLGSGCATSRRSDEYGDQSELPWNVPQPWEGSPFWQGHDR